MHKPWILLLALVAVVCGTAAGGAPVTTTTTVAEESCAGDDLVLPEHDACAVTMTSVTAADTAPTLEVRLRTAAGDRGVPTGAIMAWEAGDCGFIVDHDGGTTAGPAGSTPEALLHVLCGDSDLNCTGDPIGVQVNCGFDYENETVVAIEPAVRDGDELVVSLTFDEELAEWASSHDVGAKIGWGTGAVGPRVSGDRPPGATIAAGTCGTDSPCFDFGGDFIYGDRPHLVD